MKATIREYMGSEERDRRLLSLEPWMGTVTLGRSESCTYTIGKTLGNLALGISKVQATITAAGDTFTLKDGGVDGVSTNGIYCHAEKIEGSIALTPGLELVLFKHGMAKVTLVISDGAVVEYGKDTYTGQDLLSVLQVQVQTLDGEIGALHHQVEALGNQLAQREAIDTNQEQRLMAAEQRLNRVLTVLFAAIAAIVLASGWVGGSNEDKKQWSSTLTSIAIGVAALYFKSKDKEVEKPDRSI